MEEQVLGKLVKTYDHLLPFKGVYFMYFIKLNGIINSRTMFNFLNTLINECKKFPSINNRIEGGVNAQLRELLRNHKGLSTLKRAKACFTTNATLNLFHNEETL